MGRPDETAAPWTRRRLLAASGAGLAVMGCGGRAKGQATDHSAADSGPPTGGGEPERDSGGAADDTGSPGSWASGGTASVDPDHYPDPFADAPAPRCTLTCAAVLGPCYAPAATTELDISEGVAGLPTLFALRFVRAEDCAPVAGLRVELWATDRHGRYSGPTTRGGGADEPSTTGQCHDDTATEARFQRGERTTDSAGVVRFHGVFPGWYPGRAIHLHLRVFEAGTELLTTQLYLDDALGDAVYLDHPDYRDRPGDGSDGGPVRTRMADEHHTLDLADYTMATERTASGALLASMDLALRQSSDEELCRD